MRPTARRRTQSWCPLESSVADNGSRSHTRSFAVVCTQTCRGSRSTDSLRGGAATFGAAHCARRRSRAPARKRAEGRGLGRGELVAAARAAAGAGAPRRAAVLFGRALAEPPPPEDEPQLLLELGSAEASAGLDGWCVHLEAAVDAAPDGRPRADAARLFARALNRAQRFAEAVEVLDRAAACSIRTTSWRSSSKPRLSSSA